MLGNSSNKNDSLDETFAIISKFVIHVTSLRDQTYEADKNGALRSYAIPSNAIKVLSVACISHAETTASLLSEKYASLLICALFPTIKSCRFSVSLLSLIGAKSEILAQAIMLKVCNFPVLSKQHAKLVENLCNVSTDL